MSESVEYLLMAVGIPVGVMLVALVVRSVVLRFRRPR